MRRFYSLLIACAILTPLKATMHTDDTGRTYISVTNAMDAGILPGKLERLDVAEQCKTKAISTTDYEQALRIRSMKASLLREGIPLPSRAAVY